MLWCLLEGYFFWFIFMNRFRCWLCLGFGYISISECISTSYKSFALCIFTLTSIRCFGCWFWCSFWFRSQNWLFNNFAFNTFMHVGSKAGSGPSSFSSIAHSLTPSQFGNNSPNGVYMRMREDTAEIPWKNKNILNSNRKLLR